MKPNTPIQKIISILMPFILMVEFSGCYSKRILSTSEITQSDHYLIHSKEAALLTYNDTIYDGILSGNLDFNTKNLHDSKYAHIYLLSDSLLTINNDRISLPVNSIKEINQRVHDPAKTKTLKTVLIIAGSVGIVTGLTFLTIGIIQAARDVEETAKSCSDLNKSACWAPEDY